MKNSSNAKLMHQSYSIQKESINNMKLKSKLKGVVIKYVVRKNVLKCTYLQHFNKQVPFCLVEVLRVWESRHEDK